MCSCCSYGDCRSEAHTHTHTHCQMHRECEGSSKNKTFLVQCELEVEVNVAFFSETGTTFMTEFSQFRVELCCDWIWRCDKTTQAIYGGRVEGRGCDETSNAALQEKKKNAVYFGSLNTKGSAAKFTQTNKCSFDKTTATAFAFYSKTTLFPASSTSWLAIFVKSHSLNCRAQKAEGFQTLPRWKPKM